MKTALQIIGMILVLAGIGLFAVSYLMAKSGMPEGGEMAMSTIVMALIPILIGVTMVAIGVQKEDPGKK